MKWPDAVPFDPSRGTASAAVLTLLEGPGSSGPALLLAVGPVAQQEGWAAPAAIALADAFVARGENVVLADLSLRDPELHTLLQCSNEEGLTDVFLFGASLEHTTLIVPGKKFRLIPASPYTPDESHVLLHRRWRDVFAAFAHSGSKLLVYLPVDIDGTAAFSDRVDHTIVLADRSELEDVRQRLSDDADVTGVLTLPWIVDRPQPEPPSRPAPLSPRERDEADFDKIRLPKDNAREALIADLRARQRAALMAPPASMQPLPNEESALPLLPLAREPIVRPTAGTAVQPAPLFSLLTVQPTAKRARAWFSWLLLLLLIVLIVAGAWYVWQTRVANGADDARAITRRATAAAAPASVPNAVAPAASNADRALPYSVAIASYYDLEVALGRYDQLVEQAPELTFYVGPIDVQGRVFYRIMAGPVPDSASALMLRDTLIVKRIKTISSGWDVLNTPYAFLLGEYSSLEAAEAERDKAVSKSVPSYIVATASPEGSIQYNVYAGAYMGPGDAEFMRRILKSAGLPDHLVERTGSIRS